MNLLHRNSFYLGDIYWAIFDEMRNGFISTDEKRDLKSLLQIVDAKIAYSPKGKKIIPNNMTVSEKNKIPIDKILSQARK